MPSKYFMLAGEASGDLHASKLIAALRTIEPDARFVGMGGPKMAAAGLEVVKDLQGMQVVGFWEVAKQYGFFKKVFYELLDRVKQEHPSALICVDYPGFNLRFAREVRKLGIPVLYYIVPQVWAWKALRAKSMAEFVDRAFCVFEFEPPFFEKYGLKTKFVGHPLIDCGLPIADCGLATGTDAGQLPDRGRGEGEEREKDPETRGRGDAGKLPSGSVHGVHSVGEAAERTDAETPRVARRAEGATGNSQGPSAPSERDPWKSTQTECALKGRDSDDAALSEIKAWGMKLSEGRRIVALMPGSRAGEFGWHAPELLGGLSVVRSKMDNVVGLLSVQQGVAKGCDIERVVLQGQCNHFRVDGMLAPCPKQVRILSAGGVASVPDVFGRSEVSHSSVLPALADFSVVKSGTSTLEAGLAGKPMCVVYKASAINYAIAHLLVNIPVFSLVNIVLGRYAVPELLQSEVNPQRIAFEIRRGLTDQEYIDQQRAALAELPKKLGGPGASARAAKGIVDFLKGRE